VQSGKSADEVGDERCPRCSEVTIHEVGAHLVCDRCHAMLVSERELAATFHELDGVTTALAVEDVVPSDSPCPRCGEPMQSCTLGTGCLDLAGRFLRCARDGVWIERSALVAGYARTSRSPKRQDRGPTWAHEPRAFGAWPTGSAGAAIAEVAKAFTSSSPASLPWPQRTAPAVHAVFMSAFRGRQLACPRCTGATLAPTGERWACGSCSGSFVEDAALEAMVSDMTRSAWEMPPVRGQPGDLRCPVCSDVMLIDELEALALARCGGHGVWFEHDELVRLLARASEPPHGLGAWLHRVFRRR
jgi:ribosomal protein S27AE